MRLRQSMLSRRPITVIGLAAAHIGTTGGAFGVVQAFEYANSHEVGVWSAANIFPVAPAMCRVFSLGESRPLRCPFMTQSGHWARKVLAFKSCIIGGLTGAHEAARVHYAYRRCARRDRTRIRSATNPH